jgi:type I restriction enzyme S subunit
MPDEPPLGLRPDHWAIVQGILRRHVPGHEVWAFGSRARGTAKRYSDLDLAVVSDRPLPWQVTAALAEDFVESDLPWRVDVVDLATAGEGLRASIMADRVVIL